MTLARDCSDTTASNGVTLKQIFMEFELIWKDISQWDPDCGIYTELHVLSQCHVHGTRTPLSSKISYHQSWHPTAK